MRDAVLNDVVLRVLAGVFVVFAAVLAYVTSGVWLCAAVIVGAAIALVEHVIRG